MSFTAESKKIDRNSFIILAEPESGVLEKVGRGFEELSISFESDVESITDVLGETEVNQSPYSATIDLGDYILDYTADKSPKYAKKIEEIVDNRLIGSEAIIPFYFVDVYKKDTDGNFYAQKQNALIKINEKGGDTKGLHIGHELTCTGAIETGILKKDSNGKLLFEKKTKTIKEGDRKNASKTDTK